MASAFFTLLAGALVLLCFYLYTKYTFWKRNGVPTAKGYVPLLGHLLPTLTTRVSYTTLLQKVYNDYKDRSMVGLYKGTKPMLLVRDPNLVKTILQAHFTSFHMNGMKIQPELDPLLANNPFFNYGEVWTTGRKRLTYAFSNMRLKILFATVSGVCKKFEDFLNRRLQSNSKFEVELKRLFSKFTGEVVANAGLGIEGFCFEDKAHTNSFDRIGGFLYEPTLLEILCTQIIFFFPMIGRLFKISFLPKHLDQFFRRIVAENLEFRRNESVRRDDFLQLMVDLEKSGEKMDEEVLVSHVVSFYVDGFETSSLTLTYIGYQLAAHPEVQEKLREEVKSTINKHGGTLTYESLKDMTYMNQVISESQRFYSALGFMTKVCTDEFELQGFDGLNCRVKPGTEILISSEGLHHDPKYWDNPEVFDPERFSEDRKHSVEKMTFLPFGEGPRICVGMRMAMLQMKACLAALVRSYKLELSPKTKVPLTYTSNFPLSLPKGGVWVNISKL